MAAFDASVSAAAPASSLAAFESSAESHRRRLDRRVPSSGAASASSALRFSALPPAIAPALTHRAANLCLNLNIREAEVQTNTVARAFAAFSCVVRVLLQTLYTVTG